jgi:hypothetical protein
VLVERLGTRLVHLDTNQNAHLCPYKQSTADHELSIDFVGLSYKYYEHCIDSSADGIKSTAALDICIGWTQIWVCIHLSFAYVTCTDPIPVAFGRRLYLDLCMNYASIKQVCFNVSCHRKGVYLMPGAFCCNRKWCLPGDSEFHCILVKPMLNIPFRS